MNQTDSDDPRLTCKYSRVPCHNIFKTPLFHLHLLIIFKNTANHKYAKFLFFITSNQFVLKIEIFKIFTKIN